MDAIRKEAIERLVALFFDSTWEDYDIDEIEEIFDINPDHIREYQAIKEKGL